MNDTKQARQDESFFSRASAYTRSMLEALVSSPLANQALQQVEDERLEQRRALLIKRQQLDAAHPGMKKPTAIASEKAAIALQDAEKAFLAARTEYQRLVISGYGLETSYNGQRKEIDKELLESADQRLADFVHHAKNILTDDLVRALEFWIDDAKSRYGHTVQRSNVDEVAFAKNAVRQPRYVDAQPPATIAMPLPIGMPRA